MIQLFPDQQKFFNDIVQFFVNGGKHLIAQAPTGFGKTIVFAYMTMRAIAKGNKVLILTNRAELLFQTGGTLSGFNLNPFYIQAGAKFINFNSQVYVAMIETFKRRMDKPMWRNWILNSIDIIIIDEGHLQDFNDLFECGLFKDKKVITFTATPRRTGKMRQLGLDYEAIIIGPSISYLIKHDRLVGDDYYGVKGADLNNITWDHKKGDYSESDMFNRFNSPKLYAGVVKNWLQITPNTHTLGFCCNIEHTIQTCEEFHKHGIDARFVVSKMSNPKEPKQDATEGAWVRYQEKVRLYNLYLESFGMWSGERSYIVTKFKRQEFPVLLNASILTTGFDCPSIETVLANRATSSLTLWYQMIGRAARTHPGKTHFNLLDFGDNANRLGHYTTPQHWGLWHEESKSGGGVAPVKECGFKNNGVRIKSDKLGCGRLIMASYKICPFCGFDYPKKELKEIDLQGLMYQKSANTVVAVKKIKDMNVDELYSYFKVKGHNPTWLWRQLYYKTNKTKMAEFLKNKGYSANTITRAIVFIDNLQPVQA